VLNQAVAAADIHLLLYFDYFHFVAYVLAVMRMVAVIVMPLFTIKILNPRKKIPFSYLYN
jgi:hypothetical protein